jgi:hypothetical protein
MKQSTLNRAAARAAGGSVRRTRPTGFVPLAVTAGGAGDDSQSTGNSRPGRAGGRGRRGPAPAA